MTRLPGTILLILTILKLVLNGEGPKFSCLSFFFTDDFTIVKP